MKGETLLAVIRFALLLILIIFIALLAIFGPSNTTESKNAIASRLLLLNENYKISSVKYPVTVITTVVTTTLEVTTLYLDPGKLVYQMIPKVQFFRSRATSIRDL